MSNEPTANDTEQRRLQRLHSYSILDTLPERSYDDLLAIATSVCGAPIGAVSLIDENRQWFKSRVGLTVSETARKYAFCARTIEHDSSLMVVPDTLEDPRFRDNPLVTGEPGLRFYAGEKLHSPEGLVMGALCVMDRKPRPDALTPVQREAMAAIARQVTALLELRYTNERLNQVLLERDHYEQQLRDNQIHLESQNAELMAQSRLDPLTGLSNRRAFEAALADGVAQARQRQQPLSVAVLDIDHFKYINDNLGHVVGDHVLKEVARLIRNAMGTHHTASRFGGEEFVAVMPELPLDQAATVCEDIRLAIGALPLDAPLSVSIGVTAYQQGDTPESTFTRADQALYEAKRNGRNRVVAH